MGPDHLPMAFKVAMVLGFLGMVPYYFMHIRLARAGIRVKFFVTIFDVLKMFRQYKEVGAVRGWSNWPVYAWWILGALSMCLAVIGFRDMR